MIDYSLLVNNLLVDLDGRSQNIIKRRFGLDKPPRETLQEIGNDYGVTRERIRQLENKAVQRMKKNKDILKPASSFLYSEFNKRGGIGKEESILRDLGGEEFQNYIFFLLEISESFYRFRESDDFYTFWTIDPSIVDTLRKMESNIVSQLVETRKLLALQEIKLISELKGKLSSDVLPYFIEVSKKVAKNAKGYYGLSDWPEVNPRNIKDKIYLVLKEAQEPLHFKIIAERINSLPEGARRSGKVSHQSVHNELIKDERFSLVGRGIYALSNMGYKKGPTKNLITDILREEGRPLSKKEIVKKARKISLMRESTILSSLNNKDLFVKNSEGKYFLREK